MFFSEIYLIHIIKLLSILKVKMNIVEIDVLNELFVDHYIIATLSKSYLIVNEIIMASLNLVGQF